MTSPRTSAETPALRTLWAVVTIVVGLAMMFAGFGLLFLEVRQPPSHSAHVYLFSAIAVAGAFLLRPDPLFAIVQRTLVIIGPYVPMIGGRRSYDPPPLPPLPPNSAPPSPTGPPADDRKPAA